MQKMLSNGLNYQVFFFLAFSKYLLSKQYSVKTRKNYLSDLCYFLDWIEKSVQTGNQHSHQSPLFVLQLISDATIQAHKASMITAYIPPATINRRLSTIRLFFSFCHANQWIPVNPATSILNIKNDLDRGNNLNQEIDTFISFLETEKASKATIRNYTSDVRQFIQWMNQLT